MEYTGSRIFDFQKNLFNNFFLSRDQCKALFNDLIKVNDIFPGVCTAAIHQNTFNNFFAPVSIFKNKSEICFHAPVKIRALQK